MILQENLKLTECELIKEVVIIKHELATNFESC